MVWNVRATTLPTGQDDLKHLKEEKHMPLTMVTNLASINGQRHLQNTERMLRGNFGRLSSGLRINHAGDDAAGLGISEKLKSQIRSLNQAERNAMDGISLIQTAEGAMNEVSGILTRLRELAVQSANGTLGTTERSFVQNEFTALVAEVDRIAEVTEFNGFSLLDGSNTTITFQVGLRNSTNDRVSVALTDVHASQIGTSGGTTLSALRVTTIAASQSALAVIDDAITDISAARSTFGATQNRLQVTVTNIATASENLSAANSRIRDADVAHETAQMTRNNILMQAGVSVLAQANQLPAMALSLLGG